MRIIDWISDVCSSDLLTIGGFMAINGDHDARRNAGALLDPRQERKQPVVDAAPAADPRGIDMLRPVRRESRDRGVGVWRAAQIVAVERDDARIVAQPRRQNGRAS